MEPNQHMQLMEATLGHDAWKKVGAIFRILEIGSPNIAQSKQVLKACEELLELESKTGD